MYVQTTPHWHQALPGPLGTMYRVVIADDDPMLAELVAEQLTLLGHEVLGIAHDGREAAALVAAQSPDLILMDIQMPVLDGLSAARQLASSHPLPVLLMTAYPQSGDHAVAEGWAHGVLSKPFRLAQLAAALDAAVRRTLA